MTDQPAVPAFQDDVQVVIFHAEPAHLINANDRRKGWRRRKQTLTRYWRTVAHQMADNQLRKGQLHRVERAHIEITVTWPDRNRRDVNNWQPTAKPIVDGLVKGIAAMCKGRKVEVFNGVGSLGAPLSTLESPRQSSSWSTGGGGVFSCASAEVPFSRAGARISPSCRTVYAAPPFVSGSSSR